MINRIKSLVEKGNKAMFSLLKQDRNLDLPLDCLLSAFDKMIVPILTYGCEVWGYEQLEIIEKLHLKFLTLSVGLRKSTPIIYGLWGIG
jgi:hypothetical protein